MTEDAITNDCRLPELEWLRRRPAHLRRLARARGRDARWAASARRLADVLDRLRTKDSRPGENKSRKW